MATKCEPIKIGHATITQYNEHNPHEYVKTIAEYSNSKLYDTCKDTIWLSAYATNNPASDFHWMCDACYEECKKRGVLELYNKAHEVVSRG